MARPGYNEDNSLNVAPTGTPVGRPNPHTSTGFSVNDNAGTGTTTGIPNPHTDTGFSGGQTLAGGGNNPGYQDNFFPSNNQGPPIINNDGSSGSDSNTGAGATGGSSGSGGSLGGSGLATLAGIDASKKFLGVRPQGLDGLIEDNLIDQGSTADRLIKNTTNAESENLNTDSSSILNQIINKGKAAEDIYNDLRTFEIGSGQLQIDPDLDGGLKSPGVKYSTPFMGGEFTSGLNYNPMNNQAKGFLGFQKKVTFLETQLVV
jgi:hypothetical protein